MFIALFVLTAVICVASFDAHLRTGQIRWIVTGALWALLWLYFVLNGVVEV